MNDARNFLFEVIGPIAMAILVASATIFLILHNSRKPRLFIFWIIGVHTLVISAVGLILIWNVLHSEAVLQPAAQRDLRFDSVAVTFMGIGILMEGLLLSLVCRLRSNAGKTLPLPSVVKSCIAALIGTAFSIVSFIVAYRLFDIISPLFSHPSLSDD